MTQVMERSRRSHTAAIVSQLKEAGQDKEWYPTTDEIITCIRRDLIGSQDRRSQSEDYYGSVLDIGAGDGTVLERLTEGDRFAIEQSSILINQQDKSVITIGTDFYEQTLIDKSVNTVFSNPPYSEYVEWVEKIIREAMAMVVYLVIPSRWRDNAAISKAIKLRKAETEILGSFDFENADRAARAKVDVVKVKLGEKSYYGRNDEPFVDPFAAFFESTFAFNESSADEAFTGSMDDLHEQVNREVMAGRNYIDVLEERYHADLQRIFELYQSLTKIDLRLLKAIGVDETKVASTLRTRMKNLKHTYWQELFTNFEKITERLTTSTRQEMIQTLNGQTNLDFTAKNAHAIASWVIKNANSYFDSQLDDLMRSMISGEDSFLSYKSNQRTFGDDNWRYNLHAMRSEASHFKFDYRIVLTSFGGFDSGFLGNNFDVRDSLKRFINDLLAVASTVGFDTSKTPREVQYDSPRMWEAGKAQVFYYYNHTKEKELPLFRIKAFKNQNAHIQFDQHFILALNVALGRINGWLKTKEQAAEELGEDIKKVATYFAGVRKIESSNDILRLDCAA